jgi:hypothetical protein
LQVAPDLKTCDCDESNERDDREDLERKIKLAEIAKHMRVFKCATDSGKPAGIRRCPKVLSEPSCCDSWIKTHLRVSADMKNVELVGWKLATLKSQEAGSRSRES